MLSICVSLLCNGALADHIRFDDDNQLQGERTRARLDVTLRWEMIEDLYWRLSFQGSYDNQPPGEDASTTDYSVVSGLAYDF